MNKHGLYYRFDDWEDAVDCNDCEHYLTNKCDGVSEGATKPCNSFSATRKVLFPERLEALEQAVRSLRVTVALIGIGSCILAIAVMLK